MVYVCFFIGAPCFIASEECVLGADNFPFEERRQGGMVFREAYLVQITSWSECCSVYDENHVRRQTLNAQIAAHVGLGHIHVLDLHVNVIHLAVRLLRSNKFAAGAKIG